MNLANLLQAIGMNAMEQEIYMLALKYNEIAAGKISKFLNQPRSSTYGYINKMVAKQRLQESKYKSITTYTATGAKELALLLEKKQKKIGKIIYEINENTHLFKELQGLTNYLPNVRIHHGIEALELIVENTRFDVGYFIWDIDAMSRLLKRDLEQIIAEFSKEGQKQVKSIMVQSPMAMEYKKLINQKKKNYEIKFLPENIKSLESDTLLFAGKYIYIAYKNPVVAIEINNPLFYENQRVFFETMWNGLYPR